MAYQVLNVCWSLLKVFVPINPIHLVILVIWWAGIIDTHVMGHEVGCKNRLRICIIVCALVKMLWLR